jgi:hypothetical protein
MHGRCTTPPKGGFKKRARECHAGFHEPVSLVSDRLLAILVDQRSDLKVPDQALSKLKESDPSFEGSAVVQAASGGTGD